MVDLSVELERYSQYQLEILYLFRLKACIFFFRIRLLVGGMVSSSSIVVRKYVPLE